MPTDPASERLVTPAMIDAALAAYDAAWNDTTEQDDDYRYCIGKALDAALSVSPLAEENERQKWKEIATQLYEACVERFHFDSRTPHAMRSAMAEFERASQTGQEG